MASFDDNPIVQQLQKFPKYYNSPETAWQDFKSDFIAKSPEQRVTDLWTVDQWMEAGGDRVSHQSASLLNAKRELDDIHQAMRKAGR